MYLVRASVPLRLVLLVCTLLAASTDALPQAPHNQIRDYRFTGDDPASSLYQVTYARSQQLRSMFGISSTFISEMGGWSRTNFNGSYRRLLNTLLFIEKVDGSLTSLAEKIHSIKPIPDSGPLGSAVPEWTTLTSGAIAVKVKVARRVLLWHNVLIRGAILNHEARHRSEPHLKSPGYLGNLGSRLMCQWTIDGAACQKEGTDSSYRSCDRSWIDGCRGREGAQTRGIKFVERASALSGYPSILTPLVVAEARAWANDYINKSYMYHPGFNLSGFQRLSQKRWTVGYRATRHPEVAYFADPDGPVYAITGIGLRMKTDQGNENKKSLITTMHIWRRPVYDDGSLGDEVGDEELLKFGRAPDHGLELSAVKLPPGTVATGFVVQAGGSPDQDANIQTLALRYRSYSIGGLGAVEMTRFANGSRTNMTETNVTLPSGSFLTGLGFGSRDRNVDYYTYNSARRGAWTVLAGSKEKGESYDLRCPSGHVAVGTVQNSRNHVVTSTSIPVVGYFGILCAPRADVLAGTALSGPAIRVAHGSYYDRRNQRYYQAGVGGNYLGTRAERDLNLVRKLCPQGYALSAVETKSSTLAIHKIDEIKCRKVARVSGAGETTEWVRVGGSEGVVVKRAECRSSNYIDGIYIRSYEITRGFALHCGQGR